MEETRSAQDRVQELVIGLGSEVEDERKLCLTWLAQIGTEDVLPHLERMTTDPSVAVCGLARQLSAELRERLEMAKDHPWGHDPVALLAHADPRARLAGAILAYDKQSDALRAALVERLEAEQDAFVRASIVKALRHYPDPRVLELLADHLLDPDARVRSNTVEALMAYDHPQLQKRVSHLLHDPDMRVQGTVLIYLAKRMPDRIRPLMEKMATSPEAWARRTARYAYRALGWEPPAGQEESDAAKEVARALASQDHDARVQAVWKALELPIDERLEILRRALSTEEHPHVVATLTRALGHPGHTEDLPLLAKYLTSEDARVRSNTVEGIARIGGADALHLLEPLDSDPSPRVRSAVLLAVEKLRRRRALGALRGLLDSEIADDLGKAVIELAHMPRAEADTVLDIATRAWEPERRAEVVDLLKSIKLHGAAQEFAEELCTRWAKGAIKVSGATPVALASEAKLALQGAQVLRLWEAGRITDEELKPVVTLVEEAEEEIAQGRMVQEAIKRRHDALVKLARTARKSGEKEGKVSSLTQRIRVLSRDQIPADAKVVPLGVNTGPVGIAMGPPPLATHEPFAAPAPENINAAPAVTPPPPRPALKVPDPTEMSYLPGGFKRIGTSKSAVLDSSSGRFMVLGVAVAIAAVVFVVMKAPRAPRPEPSRRPSPSASVMASAMTSASPGPAIKQMVTRTGRIVEIRDEGAKIVIDVDGSQTEITIKKLPRKEPRIGDFLTITGTINPAAATGSREQIVLDSLPE